MAFARPLALPATLLALCTACGPASAGEATSLSGSGEAFAPPDWLQVEQQEPEVERELPRPLGAAPKPPAPAPRLRDLGSRLVLPPPSWSLLGSGERLDFDAMQEPAAPSPTRSPSGPEPLAPPPGIVERRAGELDDEAAALAAREQDFEALVTMSPDATTVFVAPGRADFEWHGLDLGGGVRPVMTFGMQAWENEQLRTDLALGVGLEFATGEDWSLRTLFEYYEGPWNNGYRLAEDLRYYGLSVGVRF